MAGSDIKVDQLGIGKVLKDHRLRVPKHQREYKWTDEHVKKLFEDFSAAINGDGPYFLGTIVTVRDEAGLVVVDGQQRLATTSIFLAAMREYLDAHGVPVRAQYIRQSFLSTIDPDLQEEVPKLSLNVDDAALFRRIVTGEEVDAKPAHVSHRRLVQARDLARAQVQKIVAPLGEADRSNELNRWIRFVEQRADIVLLIVPDAGSAYRMFQTLNDRGLSASRADLIKSLLFEKAGKREDLVERGWSYMHSTIESAFPDDDDATLDFLRYALIVQRGHLRADDTFVAVQNMVQSEATAAEQAATLETLANVYVATTNPQHERWNPYPGSMRRALVAHRTLDVKPMRPLLMAIGAKMAPKDATESLSFLVSLAVRLYIASSTRSSTVEEPLGNVARDVYKGSVDTAAKLRDALDGITPTDAAFRDEFARARVSNEKLARYYLRSLEESRNGVRDPHFEPLDDPKFINLEHVLPKKPEAGWKVDDDTVKQLSTRLGNLALLRTTDNSNAKSKTFAEKVEIYRTSGYELTRHLATFGAWDSAAIDTRQAALADIAVKTWPIRPPVAPTPPKPKRPRKVQPEDINEIAYRTMREATDV